MKISGLTQRQRELMDCLWALETTEEVNTFIEDLDCDDRWDAVSLVWLAGQVLAEEEGHLSRYEDIADSIICKARR